LQKRFYILFVARGDDGQLRKISIPVHYLYVFLVGASIVGLSLTGIASSYLRMLLKVSHYNELRTEREDLRNRYSRLEQVAKERDIQVASLGSLAGEVSSLYGLKADPNLVTASSENVAGSQVVSSLDQLGALKTSALSGATMTGLSLGLTRNVTTADWLSAMNRIPSGPKASGPIDLKVALPAFMPSVHCAAVTFCWRVRARVICEPTRASSSWALKGLTR
jgi:hypothetical protein